MKSKAPKPKAILLCEDIRKEEGGKRSLLGVLADSLSVLPNEEGSYALSQICLFGEFGKTGQIHEGYVEVLDPNGKELVKTENTRVSGEDDIVLTMKIKNFLLPVPGEYKFHIYLDKKKVSTSITIELIKKEDNDRKISDTK